MKVFVLGGTGSIGAAVVQALLERGHEVFALGRTAEACDALKSAGATSIPGDLTDPATWIGACDHVDGVIHAAMVWNDQSGRIDRQVVHAVLRRLQADSNEKAFIYTGGCWLYGETGDAVATEESERKPLNSFDSSIPTIEKVLTAERVRGMVIHPAMVYEHNGGVFEHIFDDAENLGYVRIVGGEQVRWPLVHRDDLAQAYALMLEKGERGDEYNVATNHGVAIGKLTRVIARRLGIHTDPVICDVPTAMQEIGSWAEGYALDQQMSGDKARQRLGWTPQYEDVFAEIA